MNGENDHIQDPTQDEIYNSYEDRPHPVSTNIEEEDTTLPQAATTILAATLRHSILILPYLVVNVLRRMNAIE
jgi:hypothetical protein